MTNTNNLAKHLISAVAHTANYLKLATERLRSLEGNASGIEDQLSDIQELLSELRGATQGFTYGTPEYWQHQRVEIFKAVLVNISTDDKFPHEVLLLAGELSDGAVKVLRSQDITLEDDTTHQDHLEEEWVSSDSTLMALIAR
jgi:hypothetical protein